MKILHIADSFLPTIGGVQILLGLLAREQRARGHELAIVSTGPDPELSTCDTWEGIAVHRIDFASALRERSPAGIGAARSALKKLRREFQPDLVHLHLTGPGAALHLQTLEEEPCPWLVAVHTPLPAQRIEPESYLGRVFTGANCVVAISDFSREKVLEHALDLKRLARIYNAVDGEPFEPALTPREPRIVLGVGRMVPEKGFDLALEAFERVAGAFPEVELHLAGGGSTLASLKSAAAASACAERVRFLGWTPPEEVPALLARAQLVVVPSRCDESFGLVAVEAALARRPVVACAAGGLSEVVLHEKTGLLVPREDPRAMVQAMQSLLADEDYAAQLGRCAERSVRERFSVQRFAREYAELYESLTLHP